MPDTAILPKIKAMYDDYGRVDARAIASVLDVHVSEVARSMRLEPDTVRKHPHSPAVQKSGKQLVSLIAELASYFSDDFPTALIWMREPNSELDELSPWDVIAEGNIDVVADLIRAIGTGQTT